MIEFITPSRGRPEKLKRMWDSALKTAFEPHKLFLRLGVNEEEVSMYASHVPMVQAAIYPVRDWTTVYTVNLLAEAAMRESDSDLFFVVADDCIFSTPGWDKALTQHYDGLLADPALYQEQSLNRIQVYSLRDSRDANGTPHPIVTRDYIEAMGYLYPPIFLHWYADTWTSDIAKACGVFTHLMEYELVHDKPSDRGQPDETHNRIRRRGWHERDKFVNDSCRHILNVEAARLKGLMA